jgi:TP901 family phage tail tape measure protein
VGFEKIGLGGELLFEVEQAVQAMAAVSERFKQLGSTAQESVPKVESFSVKLKGFGQEAMKSVGQVKRGFDGIASSVKAVALAFLPLTYGMKKGFGEAVNLERQMSQLEAQTGATSAEVKQMGKAAMEMAVGSEDAPTTILQAMQNIKASGATVSESILATASALEFADAAGMEEAQTAKLLAQTIKVMGASFGDSQRYVDVMAKTSAKSGANVVDLSAAIRMASSQAKLMGIPFEELNAVLGVLSQAGYKGGRGGMALANMLRGLANPTTEAKEQLAAWGVTLTDTKGKLLPVSQIVSVLSKKLKGVPDSTKRAELAYKIFGGRGQQAFELLSSAGEDSLKEFSKSLFNATGEAKRMADLQLGNTWGAFQKFWNNVKLLSIEISQPFLKPIAELFTDMKDSIAGVVRTLISVREIGLEAFLSQAENSGTKLTTVQEVAIGIHQALLDLKEMWGSLTKNVRAFGFAMGEAFGLGSPREMTRLFVKILTVGGLLMPVLGGLSLLVKSVLAPAFAGAWQMAAGFYSILSKAVIPALATAYTHLVKWGATTITLSGGFGKLSDSIVKLGVSMKASLIGGFKAVFGLLKGLGGPIFLAVGLIWSYLESTGEKFESFGAVIGGVWETLKNTFGAFAEGFLSKFGDIWQGVKNLVTSIGKMFDSLFGWLWESNNKAGKDMVSVWGSVGEFIGTVISTILDGLGKMFEMLDEFISSARTHLERYILGVQTRALEGERDSLSEEEYQKRKRGLEFIEDGINKDVNNRALQIKEEKDRQREALAAAKSATETKLAGKRPEDKVNVDVKLGDQHTTVHSTLNLDGKQVATSVSRVQTEIMERSGAKKEAYQKTASREFGVTPGIMKVATLP